MPTPIDMNSPVAYYGNTGLVIAAAHHVVEHAVNLLPNLSLQQGTILGEVTASPGTFGPYAGSTVASPAAITPTLATATTGGFLAGNTTYYVVFTYINGVGETVKSTEASIAVPAGTSTNTITVTTPTALPAGAVGIKVYLGTVSGTDYYVGTTPFTTYTITNPASGTVAPPGSSTAIAATNGQQSARCILRYPVTTDQNGNIYIGTTAPATTGSPSVAVQAGAGFGMDYIPVPSVDALFWGFEVDLNQVIGLDAAALSAGFGRIENGALGGANGRLVLN